MTPVLYYHRVGPFRAGAPRKMTVTPENFRKQMAHLRRRGYAFVPLGGAGRKAIAVSFDDGYRDLLEFGLPILEEFKISAAFFLVAGAAGKTDSWYRGEEAILDWSEARELAKRGYAIGSHGLTHATLDRLSPAEVRREVGDSRKILEDRLGIPIRRFAYPQGVFTPEIIEAVREAGYDEAWATESGDDSRYQRRRFRVSANTGIVRFAAKIFKIRLGYY